MTQKLEDESTQEQALEDDEEELPFREIDQLQEHGINVADITKLKMAGMATVMSILMSTKKELLNVKGITEAKVEKLYEIANKIES